MSDAATMRVSEDKDAISSEIYIAAEPERVFRALVDPYQVVQWWGQQGVYLCKEFAADLRPGGKWRSSGIGPDGGPFEVKGEYLEVNPPRLLVHSWVASWTGDARTTVRWELTGKDGGTMVRLLHSGMAAYPGIGESYRGWPRMLGWIQAFLETGKPAKARRAT